MVYAGFEHFYGLKQGECESWNIKSYQGIEAGKKYCLCRDLSRQKNLSMQGFKDWLRMACAWKQIQYFPP